MKSTEKYKICNKLYGLPIIFMFSHENIMLIFLEVTTKNRDFLSQLRDAFPLNPIVWSLWKLFTCLTNDASKWQSCFRLNNRHYKFEKNRLKYISIFNFFLHFLKPLFHCRNILIRKDVVLPKRKSIIYHLISACLKKKVLEAIYLFVQMN